jgi:pimeloyl-ACP methyl ester carboxylesterase
VSRPQQATAHVAGRSAFTPARQEKQMTRFTGRRGKAVAIAAAAVGALALSHAGTTPGTATRAAGSTVMSLADQAVAPSYNGSVSNNGAGATVYDYPGSGTPDTSLAALGTLADGTQVTIQCYLAGAPVTGPNGQGPGNTDAYWDQVTGTSAGLPGQVPAGHAAIVPDAYIQTSAPVNEMAPACDSASVGSAGAGAASTGPATPAAPASSASSASSAADASGCPMAQQDASPNPESPDIMAPLNSMPLNQRVACAEATLHAAAQILNQDVQSSPREVGATILTPNYQAKLDGVDNLVDWLTLHGNNDNAADSGSVDLHRCHNNDGQVKLLGFDDRSGGRVIASLGDVQHAANVVVMVGGVGRGLNGNLFEDLCNAQETYDAAAKRGSVAVIAWVGYDAPTGFTDVHAASSDMAKAGAQPLLDFLAGLPSMLPNNPHLTLMAHSYGTEVAGYAAQLKRLPVGDLILIGSPGVPEATASEFKLPQHVWAAVVPGEQIGTADTLHIGGTPPTDSSFGARVFSAMSATPDHSSYWDPYGDALRNMAYIITNQPQDVQNCAVKAVSGSHVPQKVCTMA